jgi:hypothetical protein
MDENLRHRVTLEQGCQIFLYTIYQNGEKYANLSQHYQMTINYTKWRKMFQTTIKYTNHSKALQNLPKLIFLVSKYTIWQPCPGPD